MKEEEARASGDATMIGAKKKGELQALWRAGKERERQVSSPSSLIYVDEGAEFPTDFTEAGTKARHAAREE